MFLLMFIPYKPALCKCMLPPSTHTFLLEMLTFLISDEGEKWLSTETLGDK